MPTLPEWQNIERFDKGLITGVIITDLQEVVADKSITIGKLLCYRVYSFRILTFGSIQSF